MCWGGWKGIPISIWSEWVFASTTPRAASECNSAGFPFCSKDDLCLLAHLCHAKQKPYLKEAKIIEKSVVCVLKIKLLHFFHPFASHFPGSSTTPQAAACHEWLKRVIQQQGDIFMGIHDFLNSTAFCFTTSAAYRLLSEVSGLIPFSEPLRKKPWGHFYPTLGVGFWTDALQKKKV